MPLILTNSHSHEFTYTGDDGRSHTVKVLRGQAVPEGLPMEVITQLVSETVVSFAGETLLPRYVHVKEAPEGVNFNTGVVSTRKQEQSLNAQPTGTKGPDNDAIAAALAAAEAEAEAEAQRAVDAEAAEAAAIQHAAAEAASAAADAGNPVTVEEEAAAASPAAEEEAADPRAALIAELAEHGVKVHPATGEAKLREKLAEVTAAADE